MEKIIKALSATVAIATASLVMPAMAQTFEASSADVAAGKAIGNKFVFNGFGCKGSNVSPAIAWKNAPAGTKSFAVLLHDLDAPTGGAGFWHWVVINIPAATTQLAQGAGAADGKALPAGARQIDNDFGSADWGGPCPPAGDKPHRYNFTVHALKVEKLALPATATAALAATMVNANSLGKAGFTALYGRR